MSSPQHPQPGSTSALRDANARRVLATLREAQRNRRGLSQAQLARRTELAPATVSAIVRSLAGADLLEVEQGSGRRGAQVRIGRGGGLVAGVDFGHSHVALAVADLSGLVLTQRWSPLTPDDSSVEALSLASALLDEALEQVSAERSELRRIGLGLPAPLAHGIVQSPGILPSWIGLDVAQAAAATFGVPVDAENDANLAALAELRKRPDYPGQSLVFLKISSGLGAGIVLNGQLQRGVSGMAGELGHVSVDESGPFCRCGNRGCLETYVSVPHIMSALSDAIPGATFGEVISEARAGNRAASRALEDSGHHLGEALAMVVNLLDPGTLVIGGDLSQAGELVLTPLRASLRRHCLAPVAKETQVVVATLGGDASLIGAIEVALDHLDVFAGLDL